ncbi:MAG: hypothetical protein V9E88_10740 [Ferruginibacter sp.]
MDTHPANQLITVNYIRIQNQLPGHTTPIKPLYRKIAMKPIPVMARAAAPVVKPPVAAVTRRQNHQSPLQQHQLLWL